jgi:hypothetical protein
MGFVIIMEIIKLLPICNKWLLLHTHKAFICHILFPHNLCVITYWETTLHEMKFYLISFFFTSFDF